MEMPKQERYKDERGDDWIDEFARTSTEEEFRGAMRFTIGKYTRRLGKKDSVLLEVTKITDYAQRWLKVLKEVYPMPPKSPEPTSGAMVNLLGEDETQQLAIKALLNFEPVGAQLDLLQSHINRAKIVYAYLSIERRRELALKLKDWERILMERRNSLPPQA